MAGRRDVLPFVNNAYGKNVIFLWKNLRKCIKKFDFLFLFLVFCLNILNEYLYGPAMGILIL